MTTEAKKPKGKGKPAALSAGLVVTKGADVVTTTTGAPQRSAEVAPAEADGRAKKGKTEFAQLNFKLEPEWVKEFQTYAFNSGRKNNELLKAAFEALKEKEALA